MATLRIAGIDVEDADDPWMCGRRQGAGFALETLGHDGVIRQVGQQDLDRDFAAQALVIRPVDGRHTARAERGEDPISTGEQVSAGWHGPSVPEMLATAQQRHPDAAQQDQIFF